jgi:hypothetical protein
VFKTDFHLFPLPGKAGNAAHRNPWTKVNKTHMREYCSDTRADIDAGNDKTDRAWQTEPLHHIPQRAHP